MKKFAFFFLRSLLLLAIPIAIVLFTLQYWQGPRGNSNAGIHRVKAAGQAGPTSVPQYEKYELTYPYTGSYTNPNDPSQVDVEATFTAPSGTVQTVPGFFFQNFTRSGSVKQETLTYVPGSDSWKVRYAPSEIGMYTYTVTLKDSTGTSTLDNGSFTVTPSSNPGFIRAVGLHLQRDNGQPFIPLGVNAPWFQPTPKAASKSGGVYGWGDGTYGVDYMYQQFLANGVNFYHLWTCSWTPGNASPWAKPNIGCDSSSVSIPQMSQPDSWEVDYMVDQAQALGIYFMPILKHRDQLNFTSADMIKSRYFVARWGYSTNLVAWDFNKEGAMSPTANHAWTTYMNSIDSYQHLRTTSEGDHYSLQSKGTLNIYNQIFSDPLMTLVQTHDYTNDCTDAFGTDSALALFYMKLDPSGTDPRDFHNFNKPSIFGETGVHPYGKTKGNPCGDEKNGQSSFYTHDNSGLIMKSEAWGSLMGSAGVEGPWYFYYNPGGAWTQFTAFKGINAYVAALPPIPDSANLFTTYNDNSQATVSDARLRVIGRKNPTFSMLYVQNTTGAWGNILRQQTPTPVGGTITLAGMQPSTTFTITWYNTDTGVVVETDSSTSTSSGLVLTVPGQITQNIAAIVTAG